MHFQRLKMKKVQGTFPNVNQNQLSHRIHFRIAIQSDPPDSWCAYQKAVAGQVAVAGQLRNFKHPPAFDQEVQTILQPIYEELTDEKLLERCLGANTQNNN